MNFGRLIALTTLLNFSLLSALGSELPETKRINSVKSLTHTLGLIEKEHKGKARFFTMKLQIWLEDNYISQGTAVVLKPQELSEAIEELIEVVKADKKEAGTNILRRYKDGEFHEK